MNRDTISISLQAKKAKRLIGVLVAVLCCVPGMIAATTALPHAVLPQPIASCVNGTPMVSLVWQKLPGATSYSVFRNKRPAVAWSNQSSKQKSASYSDTKLAGAGTYEYQIKTFFNLRYTFSNLATVTVPACASSSSSKITQSNPVAPMSQPVVAPPTPMVQPVSWGAYTGDNLGDLAQFESTVGRPVRIRGYFVAFGDAFPKEIAAELKGTGKTLLVFWEPQGNLDAIISGQWDSYMISFASDAKAYGDPILIAPYHEMNLIDSPWSGVRPGNSAAKLISAWRHTHDLVMAQGVTNVTWGWAVNQEPNPDTPANDMSNYYPGDAYVDIVGVDGFNFDSPWQSFDTVFGTMLKRLQTYHKPIYVFSIASAQGAGKAAWITDALSTGMAKYGVKAWVWFNTNKEKDWRVNSDQTSLEAFKGAISLVK